MRILVAGTICVSLLMVIGVSGHGMMLDPAGRSSRWRFNTSAPANYDDSALYCGGFGVQWYTHNGKCGFCGDDYGLTQPRPNELGGRYGEGIITKTYTNSYTADVRVEITANHLGYLYFNLCDLDKHGKETEECYLKYRLQLADGSDKLHIGKTIGSITATIVFPEGLSCDHCVLRWTYHTGNNWGNCENGQGAIGCGPQENFKSCADIRIIAPNRKTLFKMTKDLEDQPEIPVEVLV